MATSTLVSGICDCVIELRQEKLPSRSLLRKATCARFDHQDPQSQIRLDQITPYVLQAPNMEALPSCDIFSMRSLEQDIYIKISADNTQLCACVE